MKTPAGTIRKVGKIWLFAAALVAATFALAQDSRPASASETEILVSRSNVIPVAETVLVLFPDSAPMDLYVWATDVDDPQGVGGYNVEFEYVSWLLSVNSLAADSTWLASTGRSVWCTDPIIDPGSGIGHGDLSCNTFSPPPPFGPQGRGLLATLTVQAGSVPARTTLDFEDGTFLVNTGLASNPPVPPAVIPATVPSVTIIIARCADYDGNGMVTLNDIFAVAYQFGMRSTYPDWDPIYDMDENGVITLDDIFITAFQFGRRC